jgi:hypothetical protein
MARPRAYRSVSVVVACGGRGRGTPRSSKTSLRVATALRVRGNPMKGGELVDGLAELHRGDADVERRPGVRVELRKGVQGGKDGHGNEFTGGVVQVTGAEHVAEDERSKDPTELGIAVGRRRIPRPEQPGVGLLGACLPISRLTHHAFLLVVGRWITA